MHVLSCYVHLVHALGKQSNQITEVTNWDLERKQKKKQTHLSYVAFR